ncbi:MAG TPA: DUF4922 domain-containing protein [Terriglobia bacterium]|nr:DUF4922 domain-containing protein [Terriglobia bacterium]
MKSALVSDVDELLAGQSATWPLMKRGVEGLRASLSRTERVAGRDLVIRHIPHRIVSTTAAVDAASIARRPCFLCAANLPKEEHGIPFDSEFVIYCNPFPILDRHLTIVRVDHRPQRIVGSFHSMLRLAEALPDSFILYNGARCGASAPDHMHFQACSRAVFPIERDVRDSGGLTIPNYARHAIVLRDRDRASMADRLHRLMAILAEEARKSVPSAANEEPPEPMVNIAVYFDSGQWTAIVFPRSKHRPRVYETGEFTVSPATIDLCGVLVVPVEKDFHRIHGPDIERIFKEVTMSDDAFSIVLDRFASEGRS